MTFFNADLDKGLLIMHGKESRIDRPNCIIFHRLTDDQLD